MVHGTAARRLAALVVVVTLGHVPVAFGAVQATPPPASAAAGNQKQGPPQPPKPPLTAVLHGRITTCPDGRPIARAQGRLVSVAAVDVRVRPSRASTGMPAPAAPR